MPPVIQLSNLTRCYGPIVAVSGLTLEVQAGEVIGLLGPNGAGKTTTLSMLSGLTLPTSGSVSVFGKDLTRNFMEVIGRIGTLVDRPQFYDYLTARQNLLLLARLAGREITVDRVLDRLGLLHVANRKVGGLSTGVRQRLGLAQAMLTDPELLILDEPTNSLDVEATQEIIKLLRRLAIDSKVTIVLASHLLHEVESLCDRVAIMNKGRLIACERTDALISYDQTEVEVFVDSPEAAARRALEQPWVEHASVQAGRLYVKLKEPNVHQLNALLVGAGYIVSAVIPRRRTLHDYFMKVLNS